MRSRLVVGKGSIAGSHRVIIRNLVGAICHQMVLMPNTTASIRKTCVMAKKAIRPLRSEARFDLLALVIEDYERTNWPIDPPIVVVIEVATA
jgi:hypothetical protein